ncbi:MAG: type II secretion system ATPase GspE [Halanaerobiaceae bacterium]
MQTFEYRVDVELLKIFPRDILKEYRLLPVEKGEDYIQFVTDEYPPLTVIDELDVYSGYRIELDIIAEKKVKDLVNEYLDAPLETVEGMLDDLDSMSISDFNNLQLDVEVENLEELAQEAPVIKLVNAIFTEAIKKGASDIHIEPFEDDIKLRYRIDGILYESQAPPRKLFPAITTRIKIMAKLDIAERRLPQEGRIRIRVLGRELDVRVSFIPTLYGESVVLRLLDRAEVLLELGNLGFNDNLLTTYYDIINISHGIILVTGPTGSGKTTTLYATLHHLNSAEKKIITIEDPVEYQLDGINQIQVKPEIDFTFARGLRSILRQDPDIIMVGEIRDVETARIAIQAALTGHLVLATLHTNDAAGALSRLVNMGVEDFLLAPTVKAVIAQRLVRVLCPECKRSYRPGEIDIREEGFELKPDDNLFEPVGCDNCNDLGYRGRTALYELLPVSEEIEEIIARGGKTNEIRKEARKEGVKSLFAYGWEKIMEGTTTLEEVIRVTRN